MKIVCWNVAGIRASLRKGALDFLKDYGADVVCIQETKAEEREVKLPGWIEEMYPKRFWRSTDGTTQRKGLSGTCIWAKAGLGLVGEIDPPAFDCEGRITAVEFATFILVTVYTPNSQNPTSERHRYRVEAWDPMFRAWVSGLQTRKPTLVCGDFNVAIEDADVYKPDQFRNEVAGFMDTERSNFRLTLSKGWVDAFRLLHPDARGAFTFWDQKIPPLRKHNKGWRIDYFLVPSRFRERIKTCRIESEIGGSDHCPIVLDYDPRRKLTVVE